MAKGLARCVWPKCRREAFAWWEDPHHKGVCYCLCEAHIEVAENDRGEAGRLEPIVDTRDPGYR